MWGISAPIDNTVFRTYQIVRDSNTMVIHADGEKILQTGDLARGDAVKVSYGVIHPRNVNAFGTQSPFLGSLEAEARGEAHWRSVKLDITNPHHPSHSYSWTASSGKVPNFYEEERMIEIENNYGGSIYFVGQVSWVQFPDGEILVVSGRQYLRKDGRRSSWLRGCYLQEDDLPQVLEPKRRRAVTWERCVVGVPKANEAPQR